MHLSQLVRHLALPTQAAGTVLLTDVWRDERRMVRLFELFVRNFYDVHLHGTATVWARALRWRLLPEDEAAARHLPQMQTDILLNYLHELHVTLLECKFYPQALAAAPHGQRWVRATHLYQLFAYQQHVRQRFPNQELRSTLLYLCRR